MPLDYLEKYDIAGEAQASILEKAKNYTLATAADTVTALWNSLPLLPDIKTEDLLGRVNNDALAFFNEHKDTVQTSSLVAGTLIPGIAGMKLLGMARAGITSLGYADNLIGGVFAGTRQKAMVTEIQKVFAESGAGTSEYKALTRKLLAANVGQQIIDNTVIELAVVGAMNAHPYMEDYLQDPLKNFTLGVAFGSGIGGIIAYPTTRRELREATAPIVVEALTKVGIQRNVDESFTAAAKFQGYSANIRNYEATLAREDLNPLERQLAEDFKRNEAAKRAEVLNGVGPWVKDAPAKVKDELIKILSDSRFIGVDKIGFYDLDRGVFKTASTLEVVPPSSVAGQDIKKWNEVLAASGTNQQVILNTFVNPETKKAEMAFVRLSSGEIFHPSGARNAALAVDIKGVEKELHINNSDYGKVVSPVANWGEDNLLRSISSARADFRTLEELKIFSKLPDEKLAHINIDPTDLPRMNGLLSIISQLSPEQRAKLNISLRSDMPSYQAVQQFIKTRSVVGENYPARAKAIVNDKTNSVYYTRLSDSAHELLNRFVGGDLGPLNRAMDAHLRKLALPATERGNEALGAEIWAAGKKTRDEFRKIADNEGYVYLYRGMRGEAKGHRAVESYTVAGAAKAAQFGDPNIRRIHVDNIIGSVQNPQFPAEMEVLVGPAHHEIVNNIPIVTGETKSIHIPNAVVNETQITPEALLDHHRLETERQVKDMITQGFSREEISARLNIKKDAVEALDGGSNLKELTESGANYEWRRYTDADKIPEYLGPEHKLYAIRGNTHKNHAAESLANLDSKSYADQLKQIVENMTLAHDSVIAKEALDIYSSKGVRMLLDDMMLHLAEINNQNIGTQRFQSADNLLRNIKRSDVITGIGKEIINKTDRLKERLLAPLAERWLPLQQAPLKLMEFNNVINKLYSLKGWRDIQPLPTVEGAKPKWGIVQKNEAGDLIPVLNKDGSEFHIMQPDVFNALDAMREPSKELYKLHNLNRAITGQAPLNDLGFYAPPLNLVGKNYAYVIDNTGKQGTQLLVAGTDAELQQLVRAFEKSNTNENIHVVPKGKQGEHNLIENYTDYEKFTTYADVSAQHKGSATLAITPEDSRLLQNMMSSYENLILNGVRRYTNIYLSDATGWLDKLSGYYQAFSKDQPKGVNKETVHDSALAVKNILLGRDQLEADVPLKAVNSFVDMMLNRAYSKVNNYLKIAGDTAKGTYGKEFYDGLMKEAKDAGITPAWKSFDEYLATKVGETKNVAPLIVSAGNGLLATLQLRMFEVAQAAVNIMSLPILTWSALMEKLPGTAVSAEGASIKFPLRAMYAGIVHMNSVEGRRIEKELWIPRGHIDQATRQYTDVIGNLKAATVSGDRGDRALQSLVDFQNSKGIEWLSQPSDFAERFTRRITMHTGFWAAKQAYPGIDDMGATMAALSFTDRAIGNYHAAQRPTFFQGTFGSAIGLYQTYFVTYAQHIYRGIESKNFTQLAGLSALQSGLFGMSSWPGFNLLSENIVGRMNDKHYDLTTGTFRGADKHVAEMILYGFPSSMGPAFYTRGDISPRIPSTMGDIAVVNGVKEGWKAAHTLATKASQGINDGTPIQGLFEGLSLQSINRPIARWSELVTGASVTQQGNTVSPQNETWTPMGIAARMLAVRPIEEQVVRNARHLDTYYGAIDHDNRQNAMNRIKTSIRAGELNEKVVSEVAADYLRKGGSSRGWSSAVNEAMLKSEEGTRLSLLRKLEPDNPVMHMIRDNY